MIILFSFLFPDFLYQIPVSLVTKECNYFLSKVLSLKQGYTKFPLDYKTPKLSE
jgi:hypothetical protein